MNTLLKLHVILLFALFAGCTTADTSSVLTSAVQPQSQPVQTAENSDQTTPLQTGGNQQVTSAYSPQPTSETSDTAGRTAFATSQSVFDPAPRPRTRKTYLINGLASSIGNIGYGFTNLSKKIPGSELYNYASFVESSTIIRSRVTKELKAAYRADPYVEINLIGISFGANIVTIIAQELGRSKIPVNYLATLDGPAMIPIRDNVRITDNFTCTNLDCFKTNSRLSWGNKKTVKGSFKIKSSHIPLANHPQVHSRILQQINSQPPINVAIQ